MRMSRDAWRIRMGSLRSSRHRPMRQRRPFFGISNVSTRLTAGAAGDHPAHWTSTADTLGWREPLDPALEGQFADRSGYAKSADEIEIDGVNARCTDDMVGLSLDRCRTPSL